MPLFEYSARDKWGKLVQGRQQAPAEASLMRILQGRDLIVTNITPTHVAPSDSSGKRTIKKHQKVKQEDLLFFIQQSALLLEVGVPFIRTMELVTDQVESETLSKILGTVKTDVRAGQTFQSAISKYPKIFPPLWSFLIEAGEASGNLPLIMKRLGLYIEAVLNLKRKIISALIYPALLMSAALVALLFFMIRIIPIFTKLFDSFQAKLPPFTLAIVGVSTFLQRFFFYLVFLTFLAVVGVRWYVGTPPGRKHLDKTLLNIPLFGAFIRDVIVVRIMINLSTLLKSGVNILQSIDICSRTAGNVIFEAALNGTIEDIRQGKSFSFALERCGLFSPMMVSMIQTGEEGGQLSYMIEKVADYYQVRVDTFIGRLSVLIEPLILIFIGGVVGSIVIAMFLPIINIGRIVR